MAAALLRFFCATFETNSAFYLQGANRAQKQWQTPFVHHEQSVFKFRQLNMHIDSYPCN